MAQATRRVTPAVQRLNPTSIEYWKAENAKLRERNQSLHRRLHKYKKYNLQEDKRKFTFIHKGHRYEFPRLLILARSHVLSDAIGNTGQPPEKIPPPTDTDPANPMYTFDTTDIFPDFDQTTFHIFLQMLSRFCIYKPDTIQIDRIKQIWRISDYFDIPTLILNEDDLVTKIRDNSMNTFAGIQKELDFALRYNWKALKRVCLECIKARTGDLGGLTDSMRDTEIMGLLDTLVVAERRKSGVVDRDDDSMSADGLEGVRWTTPSENEIEFDSSHGAVDGSADERDDRAENEEGEDDRSGDIDDTTMDLVLLE